MELVARKMGCVPIDTDPAVFAMQVEQWRSMSFDERIELVDRLSIDVCRLAEAGINFSSPGLSEKSKGYELAVRRFGRELADAVFAKAPK